MIDVPSRRNVPVSFWALPRLATAVVAVILPAVAPLLDHHFAERQPRHGHIAHIHAHTHVPGYYHEHPDDGPNASSDHNPVGTFDLDGNAHAFAVYVLTEAATSRLGPSSTTPLPTPPHVAARGISVPPLEQPPRF